ncbi:Gfo/Idh/MocA family oxidoreductase [Cohnella sp. GCM10027633]|uniref:Gfo/Idh/MocA family oxidoreductase n=1 Tax=unclassified Cohnella TaxID=2636738 RepID=UPI003629057A
MGKLRIGIVDLDTSHPDNWIPIIRELGHSVVGVYDGGRVYPAGYAEKFAERHGIERVFSSLTDMAEVVDLAIIHSCDWDVHLERAEAFVNAGKSIFLDKPMAGNAKDLSTILQWERRGIKVFGGSSLRWCEEIREWSATHDRKETVFAIAGCSVDEFNYGIHAYSMLHGIMGEGIAYVRYLAEHVQQHVEVVWHNGNRGQVIVGATQGYLPMYATITTQRDVTHFQVDFGKLYRSLLEVALPYYAGETPAPLAFASLAEVELAAIAAKLSRENDGQPVYLRDIPLEATGYDGALFGQAYRSQKLAGGA